MKKIYCLFTFSFIICVCSNKVKAQAFEQGTMIASGGITLFQTAQTPIFATFEYGITDKIGIGAKASYSSIGTAATQTFLGGVINWHSNIEDNDALDFYTGATVGVPFTSGNGISATGNLSILAQLGVRYYFTEQIGAFAELGYAILNPIGTDKLAGNVGISFKF